MIEFARYRVKLVISSDFFAFFHKLSTKNKLCDRFRKRGCSHCEVQVKAR